MFVFIPVRLEFQLNESRHTVHQANCLKGKAIELKGNARAAIHEDYAIAEARMIKEVKSAIQLWLREPNIRASDFELTYASEKVEDGLFYAGATCVSHMLLPD